MENTPEYGYRYDTPQTAAPDGGAQPGYQQPGYQQPGYQQPGYQQPGYQQPAYPPYGYQQPDYDPGASEAKNCMIFGILSLCVLPLVFAILGLVKYNAYMRIGNGLKKSDADVGRLCSIISLALQAVAVVGLIIMFVLFGSMIFSQIS